METHSCFKIRLTEEGRCLLGYPPPSHRPCGIDTRSHSSNQVTRLCACLVVSSPLYLSTIERPPSLFVWYKTWMCLVDDESTSARRLASLTVEGGALLVSHRQPPMIWAGGANVHPSIQVTRSHCYRTQSKPRKARYRMTCIKLAMFAVFLESKRGV
jgi:hypothetical protein